MKNALKHLIALGLLAGFSVGAMAKLPALSDEAKAKAAETAAKTAWTGKVDGYLLCKSMDKVAASYYKSAKAAGKDTKPATATPACADPGPFVYTAAAPSAPAAPAANAKPIEAAGAHSPSGTTVSPPSGKAPDAVVNPAKKS